MFETGCKSGQKDIGQHYGIMTWRCQEADEEDECDFDLCEDCLRWILYCEHMGLDSGATVAEYQ